MKREIYVLSPTDNVAVALTELTKIGQELYFENAGKGITVILREKIPFGHKVAIKDIKKQDRVYKYGEDIDFATQDIKAGQWVHTHNIASERGK
ncbi:MAG: UxaA family hydrolase [Bacillota bacterium]